jgi:hypothetical protein
VVKDMRNKYHVIPGCSERIAGITVTTVTGSPISLVVVVVVDGSGNRSA